MLKKCTVSKPNMYP